MESSQTITYAYKNGNVNLEFKLTGDDEKKQFVKILEKALVDVKDSIEDKLPF